LDRRRRRVACSVTDKRPGLASRRELAPVRLTLIKAVTVALALAGCSNDPYPTSDRGQKILYSSFSEAPKTLDPAVAYTTASHIITGNVYDTLLEYHFLKRPYELMPALAESVPAAVPHRDGGVSYLFKIRDGILFHSDPCFQLSQGDGRSRKVTAADFAFELARLADPAVNSPLAGSFAQVQGFAPFAERLLALRQADPVFVALPASSSAASVSSRSFSAKPSRKYSISSPCRSPRRCRGKRSPTTTARQGGSTLPITPSAPGPTGWRSMKNSTACSWSATRPG